MSIINRKSLLEAGAHFGHKRDKLDSRMKKYIYGLRGGVHIIDLDKTMKALNKVYEEIKGISQKGGKVLFVGTKKQSSDAVKEFAEKSNSYYINTRWLGGTLTNHQTIMKSLDKLSKLEATDRDSLTKKDASKLDRKIEKLRKNFEGIREMRSLPDAVFVVSACRDGIAIDEAKKLDIPVFAITDTDINPDVVDYPIPANDDAVRSVALILEIVTKAIQEGLGIEVEKTEVTEDSKEEAEDLSEKGEK